MKFFYTEYLKDDEYNGDIHFSNLLCHAGNYAIRVVSDLKVTKNYFSDLNEMLYSDQSEDGEYNGDNYFSKFLCHTYN